MRLDPQTEQRMRELFGGRLCCACGRPATRLIDDRFFCQEHFLSAKRGPKPRPGKLRPAAPTPEIDPPGDEEPSRLGA